MSTKEVWKGAPSHKPRLAILKILGSNPVLGVLVFAPLIGSFVLGNNLIFGGALLVFVLITVIPEIHKSIRRKETQYKLLEDRLVIKDYWYGHTKENALFFNQITKMYVDKNKNDFGTIYFIVNGDRPFNTRGFWSGEKRHHITFEDLVDVSQSFDLIKKLLKESKSS